MKDGQTWAGVGRRVEFLALLDSQVSRAVAAARVGVSRSTGDRWALEDGYVADGSHHGKRYSLQVRQVLVAAVRSGMSEREAAAVAGVSRATARRWIGKDQVVPRSSTLATPVIEACRQSPVGAMSFEERFRLEVLLGSGCVPAQAAVALGRHRDTIRREIARGQTGMGYRAATGQDVTDANLKRPKSRKLEQNAALRAEVMRGLQRRHSPEQISARLREDFPDETEMRVSHETIYQAVYVQPRGEVVDLGPGRRNGVARRDHRRNRTADLLLRSPLAVAERDQREHQRIAPAILSEDHRPVVPWPRHPRQRRRRTQRQTTQTPQLAHPRRRIRPPTLKPDHIRCSDPLNASTVSTTSTTRTTVSTQSAQPAPPDRPFSHSQHNPSSAHGQRVGSESSQVWRWWWVRSGCSRCTL